ncbi:hypothetical protein BDA96_02G004900 [Sorghum bicolor]|uniref:NB-ARC domain-containing protein n=1 Tax=Sorghum bicolor TaxID=4558 RepID=A0A921RJ87_SORBI|nr:hypothetical protein BDA96_02G004900 [Sorghum bicolor]
MAKQTESGEESYDLQKLRPEVDKLFEELDAMADKPLDDESERNVLAEISKVLEQIKAKIALRGDGKEVKDDDVLPRSKREELHNLVRLLRAALVERGAASSDHCKWPREQQDAAESSGAGGADDSKPATTGCIPCGKPRASKQQQQQSKKQEQEQEEKESRVSLTLLLRLTKNVLEPEQYYEWTTSYVDEERIYGWDKEAGEVIDALVAPDGSERMFRAAGIAGIHGSGKTALAQKVFVHDKAKDNFALRLWVCVGPPDSEDRFNLLYRMLDNLGLDTAKVEDIVDKSQVVTKAIAKETAAVDKELREKAAKMVGAARGAGRQNQAVEDTAAKETPGDAPKEGSAGAGEDANNKQAKEAEEDRIFKELLKEKIDSSRAVETSKIGVLLYILNMTLSKTSYMIVFDDIRAYRRDDDDDGCWYSNLTLQPPAEGEWGDRLAYGLPKGEHRGAVLVTCRKEDDAKMMARTGLVVRPPKLEGDDAWKLFRREYDQAKDDKRKKEGGKVEEDLLLKQLEEMKKEIVDKCLGLPVAIIEAAKGFAGLEPLPDLPDDTIKLKEAAAAEDKPPAAAGGHTRTESSEGIHQADEEAAAAQAADESE